MPIIVHSITTSLEEPAEAALSRAASLLGVQAADACIVKTSLDARKRGDIHFVHTVALTLGTPAEEEAAASRCADRRVSLRREEPLEIPRGTRTLEHRPVVVGFGPAGMFAGLLLAQNGYRPVILERGGEMDRRVAAVERFWREGTLDPGTNVQFGEGGRRDLLGRQADHPHRRPEMRLGAPGVRAVRRAGGDPLPGEAPHRYRPSARGRQKPARGNLLARRGGAV